MAGLPGVSFDMSGITTIVMTVLKWGGILLVGAVILFGTIIIIGKNIIKKKIIEFGLTSKRVRIFSGVERKKKSGHRHLWLGGKINRYLPMPQQEDVWYEGKKEIIPLLQDNNHMYHNLRVPTMEEIKLIYEKIYGINYDEIMLRQNKVYDPKEEKVIDIVGSVYLMPNPAEDVEWCASEVREADSQFAAGLLKHPAIIWLGTLTICAIIFILTIVFAGRV